MNDKKDNLKQPRSDLDKRYLDQLHWDIEPARDLWPAVHSNIRFAAKPTFPAGLETATTSSVASGSRRLWVPMSMAACMMLALGAFIMSSMSFQRAQDTYELQASYIEYQQSQISLIEQQHTQVRAQFTALLGGELGPINPTTVAEVQAVLLTIDTASLELKQAIIAQPTNSNYPSMLARTYQQELKLLNKFKTANDVSI